MDTKNGVDLDVTMEPKCHYKLRSSLKKSKSRNPLGSLDMTEVNDDITLVPPPRRVSFAASNSVKPFMDDPEKNTIWDNTYEEEVNQTDSTKSDNTNNANFSEFKSNTQEMTSSNDPQSDLPILHDNGVLNNIYCDQRIVDMEFTCLNQTIVNEGIINNSRERNLDVTCSICPSANIDVKESTDVCMEFTCQWKNEIMQSSHVLPNAGTTNRDYLLRNSTVHQEEDMSMTCCGFYENTKNKENIVPAEFIGCSETVSDIRENVSLSRPPECEMEFTCLFQNKILEKSNQPKESESHPLCEKNKGIKLSAHFPNCSETVHSKKVKVFSPHESQSTMEFTCLFQNKILERVNQPESNSICENKENIASPADFVGGSETIYYKKEKVDSPYQPESETKYLSQTKISEKADQLKRIDDNFLLMTAASNSAEMELTCKFDAQQYFITSDNSCPKSEQPILHELMKTDVIKPTGNLEMLHSTFKNFKPNVDQNVLTNDIYGVNETVAIDNKNISNCNVPSSKGEPLSPNQNVIVETDFKQQTINTNLDYKLTELISIGSVKKPVKVREFGNISVAVDVTDLSIDKNICDNDQHVSDFSRRDYDIKENIYPVIQVQSVEKSMQLNQNYKGLKANNEVSTESHDVELQYDSNSLKDAFHQNGEKIMHDFFPDNKIIRTEDFVKATMDENLIQVKENQEVLNVEKTLKSISNVEPNCNEEKNTVELDLPRVFSENPKNKNNEPLIFVDINNENKENIFDAHFKENNVECKIKENAPISNSLYVDEEPKIKKVSPNENSTTTRQTEINNSLERGKNQCLITEECSLIDSMPSLDEEDLQILAASFETQKELSREEKGRATKVIYSEPMKLVRPSTLISNFSDGFPSMQTSGLNPFNFSSIGGMEDTAQLIQTTFTKPSFQNIEENDKSQSVFIVESNISQSTATCELNRTGTDVSLDVGLQNETLKAQSILKNIQRSLITCKFQPTNYDDIANSIRTNKELCENMKKLLSNCGFSEVHVYDLEEKRKRMSLPNNTSEGNSSESMLEVLETCQDHNCRKSILLEPNKTLHEKIVDLCTRFDKALNIKHFQKNGYIFTTMYCLLIYVHIHPEDGRVVGIKAASSLQDSAEILNHFRIHHVLEKLKLSTLKSYLGQYFDVLSLLDHICLIVDEAMDFQYEFLSLQKLYSSLKMHPNSSISLEILHTSPPIWWIIRFDLASLTKIDPETLQLESKWGNINEEHVKQILRNVDEGVDSLRSFIANVVKYFERTQLKYKLQ